MGGGGVDWGGSPWKGPDGARGAPLVPASSAHGPGARTTVPPTEVPRGGLRGREGGEGWRREGEEGRGRREEGGGERRGRPASAHAPGWRAAPGRGSPAAWRAERGPGFEIGGPAASLAGCGRRASSALTGPFSPRCELLRGPGCSGRGRATWGGVCPRLSAGSGGPDGREGPWLCPAGLGRGQGRVAGTVPDGPSGDARTWGEGPGPRPAAGEGRRGRGVNRDTAGTRRSLPALPGPGTEPTFVPASPCPPGTGRGGGGQALVWREVSQRRAGLPPSPREVGARLFIFYFLYLLMAPHQVGVLDSEQQGFGMRRGTLDSSSEEALLRAGPVSGPRRPGRCPQPRGPGGPAAPPGRCREPAPLGVWLSGVWKSEFREAAGTDVQRREACTLLRL